MDKQRFLKKVVYLSLFEALFLGGSVGAWFAYQNISLTTLFILIAVLLMLLRDIYTVSDENTCSQDEQQGAVVWCWVYRALGAILGFFLVKITYYIDYTKENIKELKKTT